MDGKRDNHGEFTIGNHIEDVVEAREDYFNGLTVGDLVRHPGHAGHIKQKDDQGEELNREYHKFDNKQDIEIVMFDNIEFDTHAGVVVLGGQDLDDTAMF